MTRKQKKLKVGLTNLFSSAAPSQPEKPSATASPEKTAEAATVVPPAPSNGDTPKPASTVQPKAAQKETIATEFDSDNKQLVVFKLEDEFYGVDISVVESIIKAQRITLVPHAHEFVDGVTNLRGIIVPVIDLRARLGMPRIEITKDTRVVVVEHKSSVVGIVVDVVTEVLQILSRVIEPPSQFVTGLDANYISGIAKFPDRLITLLDLEKIFVAAEAVEK